MRQILPFFVLLFTLISCGDKPAVARQEVTSDHLFSLLPSANTGIDFKNQLTLSEEVNPYTYRNFYNGAGVGLGDFNNDGLLDIFFTGNQVDNQLYWNEGDLNFKVAKLPNLSSADSWSTGVTIVDINADGWDDIYVCKSGPPADANLKGLDGVRHNELFVNQQDGTFLEQAAEYGLDFNGLAIHATFFDYDQDGDLDAYLLSNSNRSVSGYDLVTDARNIPDPAGNKLLRCDWPTEPNGQIKYVDVSEEAGIYRSTIGFGLGVTAGDVDQNGTTDLFVSNDYFERDYLYYNQGNGKFIESLTSQLPEISLGSMGADLADLNNDGLPELFVTEMLPATQVRYQTKAAFQNWNKYQLYRDKGYHQQFSRNVLQWNRGDGRFSEISRYAGVEATDWSWGALLFDMDSDGNKDIFVANGIAKDLVDQDYIKFDGNGDVIRKTLIEEGKSILTLFEKIPTEKLVNGVFKNKGNFEFSEQASHWGLDQRSFSNGAAYGDLDNDGDLDLVVTNIDDQAFIYRNNSTNQQLTVALTDLTAPNRKAIGTKVYAYAGQWQGYQELQVVRGFQSSVDPRLHFGLGTTLALDSLIVVWPDGEATKLSAFQAGQLSITRSTSSFTASLKQWGENTAISLPIATLKFNFYSPSSSDVASDPFFKTTEVANVFSHEENKFIDFDRDGLLFWSVSNEGPALAAADVNGDGRMDFYLGGSIGQAGQLRYGTSAGYRLVAADLFAEDIASEDTDATFFDADNDGDLDLYVCSGGYEAGRNSTSLLDRIYLNEGNGKWSKQAQLLPLRSTLVSSSCVRPFDVDGDGDLDLFIGGRFKLGLYGMPTESYLLFNDGKGQFNAKSLGEIGMVTDAFWTSRSEKGASELLVCGEFMPLTLIQFNEEGKVISLDSLAGTSGLWQSLAALPAQGKELRFLAGNHGLNSRLRADTDHPLQLVINDFDQNGKAEQILGQVTENGQVLPLVRKDDLIQQLPTLRKQLLRYENYAGKTLNEIFSAKILDRSVRAEVTELASLEVIINEKGEAKLNRLPMEAQLQPVYAISILDANDDGIQDVLLGGNQRIVKPELGIYDAGFGQLLLGQIGGGFNAVPLNESGVMLRGEIRNIIALDKNNWLVARSGDKLIQLTLNNTN